MGRHTAPTAPVLDTARYSIHVVHADGTTSGALHASADNVSERIRSAFERGVESVTVKREQASKPAPRTPCYCDSAFHPEGH